MEVTVSSWLLSGRCHADIAITGRRWPWIFRPDDYCHFQVGEATGLNLNWRSFAFNGVIVVLVALIASLTLLSIMKSPVCGR